MLRPATARRRLAIPVVPSIVQDRCSFNSVEYRKRPPKWNFFLGLADLDLTAHLALARLHTALDPSASTYLQGINSEVVGPVTNEACPGVSAGLDSWRIEFESQADAARCLDQKVFQAPGPPNASGCVTSRAVSLLMARNAFIHVQPRLHGMVLALCEVDRPKSMVVDGSVPGCREVAARGPARTQPGTQVAREAF